jgi:hypothetical protein
VLLDHDDYLPRYVLITPARIPDVRVAHSLALPKGSIVTMDRGYVDFRLFARWTEAGVFFVTRPLHHMVFEVVQSRPVPENSTLRSDQTIRFTSEWAQRHGFKLPLRRIAVWNEEHQQEIVLLTNHFGFAASTPAANGQEYLGWAGNLYFAARFEVEDGYLAGTPSKIQRLITISNKQNYIEHVNLLPIVEPCPQGMSGLQEKFYVGFCEVEKFLPTWSFPELNGVCWIDRNRKEFLTHDVAAEQARGRSVSPRMRVESDVHCMGNAGDHRLPDGQFRKVDFLTDGIN